MNRFCVIVFAACVGCTANVSEQQRESAKGGTDVQTPAKEENERLVSTAQVQAENKDLAAVVEGNNQFAFDLTASAHSWAV